MAEAKQRGNYLWAKICIGIIGLILSIVLHELFHVLVHWGDVSGYTLFSRHGAVVELLVWAPEGYDLHGEEMFAYAITLATILLTVVIIFRLHDATDDRTAAQILFPNNKEMQQIPPAQLLGMAELSARDISPSRPAVTGPVPEPGKKKDIKKPKKLSKKS
jgi:hypothetical protein